MSVISQDLQELHIRTLEFASIRKKTALFLATGSGKTKLSFELIRMYQAKVILIVAPLAVAKGNYESEATKFGFDFYFVNIASISSDQSKLNAYYSSKIKDYKNDKPIVFVTNPERLKYLVNIKFDFVIADESTYFKNATSKRHKELARITKVATYVTLLSGTPIPNNVEDFFGQIQLISPGFLAKSLTAFRLKYGIRNPRFNKYTYTQDVTNKIVAICSNLAFVYLDKLISSDIFYYKNKVKLSNTVTTLYNQISSSLTSFFYCNGKFYYYEPQENDNATSVMVKMRQVISGFFYGVIEYPPPKDELNSAFWDNHPYLVDASTEQLFKHIAEEYFGGDRSQIVNCYSVDEGVAVFSYDKLEYLRNDLLYRLDKANRNVIIFYYFMEELKQLKLAIPYAVDFKEGDTNKIIKAWNDKQIKVLLMQPKSAGFGLNLQFGGNTIIWYSQQYSHELYMQANARLWRTGQPMKQVDVINLFMLTEDGNATIDDIIYRVVLDKRYKEQEAVSEIQARLNLAPRVIDAPRVNKKS